MKCIHSHKWNTLLPFSYSVSNTTPTEAENNITDHRLALNLKFIYNTTTSKS